MSSTATFGMLCWRMMPATFVREANHHSRLIPELLDVRDGRNIRLVLRVRLTFKCSDTDGRVSILWLQSSDLCHSSVYRGQSRARLKIYLSIGINDWHSRILAWAYRAADPSPLTKVGECHSREKQSASDAGSNYHLNPELLAPPLYKDGQKAFTFRGST